MAKPKTAVIVNIHSGRCIVVYCDDKEQAAREIREIEGVAQAIPSANDVFVRIDPRYDIEEFCREIYDLLVAQVPDVFKEE